MNENDEIEKLVAEIKDELEKVMEKEINISSDVYNSLKGLLEWLNIFLLFIKEKQKILMETVNDFKEEVGEDLKKRKLILLTTTRTRLLKRILREATETAFYQQLALEKIQNALQNILSASEMEK